MARRGRRSGGRRGRSGSGVPNWAIIACLVLIVSGLSYVYYFSPKPIKVDDTTLCPEQMEVIPHHEVLLFERNRRVRPRTNQPIQLEANTRAEIEMKTWQILKSVPKHSLVELYEVNYSDQVKFRPTMRLCNPGDGSGISGISGNPALARERYRSMFLERFREEFEELSTWNPDHGYSLVDSLGGVARLVMGNPELAHAAKSLTVVSDFIVPQNFTSGGRIVRSFADVSLSDRLGSFEEYRAAGGGSLDFRSARVRLIIHRQEYVRIPNIQGDAHENWWKTFFNSQNAFVEEVVRVGEW